jgi:hypothetical protein
MDFHRSCYNERRSIVDSSASGRSYGGLGLQIQAWHFLTEEERHGKKAECGIYEADDAER